ncbi:MAG: selenoneine biosynthesis selenosugar synthase SenB [Acidobacteriota bacterium]
MRVLLVCAAAPGSRTGNRRTAQRWARLLRRLGHDAPIADAVEPADVVVALHARHAAAAVRDAAGRMPVVLALTGTDLYRDLAHDADARRSVELADRLVVLHDLAPADVPPPFRDKTRVIRQSARAFDGDARRVGFRVAVVGHLRDVKDPLCAARAARLLPETSRVRVIAAGRALDDASEAAARAEQLANPRYHWLGELSGRRALQLIARARLLALTSHLEGGANVLGEAIACGTPVVASDIAASRAALGADYPALFPPGDERALAGLLARAETDRAWYGELVRCMRARAPLFRERSELEAWRALLAELTRA